MKRCPKCSRLYADAAFQFCLDDGANLIVVNNHQPTERFAVAPHVPESKQSSGKFKWLAFSMLGGFGILLVFGAAATAAYLVLSGGNSGTAKIETNTVDNREAPVISPPPLFSSSDETEIKVIMEKLSRAFVAGDVKTLDYYLADEYLEEDSNGTKFTKKDALQPEVLGERVSLHYTELKVTVEGENATVAGNGESQYRILGTLVNQKFKFKSRLVKKDQRWRGVYSFTEYLK